jgi:hypothetical protein
VIDKDVFFLEEKSMRRRDFLPALAAPAFAQTAPVQRKNRLKQGVTRGVFGREMKFEDACRDAARLGIKGI